LEIVQRLAALLAPAPAYLELLAKRPASGCFAASGLTP